MKERTELLIKGTIRFWLFALLATFSLLYSYVLFNGMAMGEPDVFIARIETILLLVVAGCAIVFAYIEVKK